MINLWRTVTTVVVVVVASRSRSVELFFSFMVIFERIQLNKKKPWMMASLFCRNSVPQTPNFPSGNSTARDEVMSQVTDMFRLTFPYTTVYPALGNLDVMPTRFDSRPHHRQTKKYHGNRRPTNNKRKISKLDKSSKFYFTMSTLCSSSTTSPVDKISGRLCQLKITIKVLQ